MHIFIDPAYLACVSYTLSRSQSDDRLDSQCTRLAMKGRWATVVYSGLFMKWSCLTIAIVLSGLRELGQADGSVVTIICLGSVYW